MPALPATCAPRGVAPGTEVEPSLAVAPGDPAFLVAAWQQDRHPKGAAGAIGYAVSRDAGKTWHEGLLAGLTACTQGPFSLVSDPTAGIGADGTAYIAALFVRPGAGGPGGFAVSVSHGFEPSVAVASDGTAYAAWVQYRLDRPDAPPRRNTFYFARTTDGGATWSNPLAVYGADSENQFHQLLVLPDGALLDVFVEGFELPGDRAAAAPNVTVRLRSVRSVDQGATWSAPIEAASFAFTAAALPGDGHPVRATGAHITAAVSSDGAAYAIFQEHYPKSSSSLNLVRSRDGGRSWETPERVVSVEGDLMLPQLAAGGRGQIGLLWYAVQASTSVWLATAPAFAPRQVLGPFDLRGAVDSGGYFLGDYAGFIGLPDGGFAAALPLLPGIEFLNLPR